MRSVIFFLLICSAAAAAEGSLKSLSIRRIADHFSAMKAEDRVPAFGTFMKGATFHVPPDDYITFRSDGKVVHRNRIGASGNRGVIAEWAVKSGRINVKTADRKAMDAIFGYEEIRLENITVTSNEQASPQSVDFCFDGKLDLFYMKEEQD